MNDSAGDDIGVSDTDRDRVVELLVGAVGNGDLQLGEYSDRATQAYNAHTKNELERLIVDLPQHSTTSAPRRAAGERTRWLVTPIGGLVRRGRWRLPRRLVFIAVMGGLDLDLRQAELCAPEATVTAVMLTGGATVLAPAGVTLAVTNIHLMGGRAIDTDEGPNPNAPVITLRVFSLLGGVRVTRGN